MSKETESQEALLRIKADSSGGELTVGKDFPDLLARVIPLKYQFRRRFDATICQQIVEKLRQGSNLDEAELVFAEDWFSEHAKKYLRLKSIGDRAQVLIEEQRVPLLEDPAKEQTDRGETSGDWVNKFREDASLVDDELIREIYARVLSGEDQEPGAFSLRTLGVLRYLDREAATAFGQLNKLLIDDSFVPSHQPHTMRFFESVGLNHEKILMLNDIGLIYSMTDSTRWKLGTVIHYRLSGHGRILAVRRSDNSSFQADLEVHLLTPAGKQLARIAEGEPDDQALNALLVWFERSFTKDEELTIAELPSRGWTGPFDHLIWRTFDEVVNQPSDVPLGKTSG